MPTKLKLIDNVGAGTGKVWKAETVCNLQQLKSIAAGAGIEIINNADDINISTGNGTYASIYSDMGAIAQAGIVPLTWTKLLCFATNGDSSNCTPDQANDKIITTQAGFYLINLNIDASFDNTNTSLFFKIYRDGIAQNQISIRRYQTTGSIYAASSMCGIVDCAANSELDLRFYHTNAVNITLTVQEANLTAVYLGKT